MTDWSWTDKHVQRRCINFSAFRLDGLGDILPRVRGCSVFDVGCNRGAISLDLVLAGARLVHGCDNGLEEDERTPVIQTANRIFADIRSVQSRFEFVDLKGGPGAIKKAFGEHYQREYDFVLMLAVDHKLRRIMSLEAFQYLVDHLAHHCGQWFVWRGSSFDEFEPVLLKRGFTRVHYSTISQCELPEHSEPIAQPAAIWAKQVGRMI